MSHTTGSIGGDASLDEMEARSELLRSELAGTVGELRSRLSPETIKSDVKDHIVRSGRDMLARIERSARENPLRTAAIGLGAAYPVLGILRSIPVPILLVGAGVALAGRANPLAGGASGNGRAAELADGASAMATQASSAVSSTMESVSGRVGAAAADVSDTVTEAVSSVNRTAADLANSATEAAKTHYGHAVTGLAETGERMAEAGRQSRDSIMETIQRHPLATGALTALAGAALAALIPHTRTEARLFGETSSKVRNRIGQAAYDKADAVVDAGERVLGSTLKAARDEGLTPDDGRAAIRTIAGRTAAVMDAASKAVLPDSEQGAPMRGSQGPA